MANISPENAADSVHAFEALTIVKKHGLSLSEHQEVVVNMCTEIATYKHKIKRMETILDEKEDQIVALKKLLKENNIDSDEMGKVAYYDVSTQCEKDQATCETQTEKKESDQPHMNDASTQSTINVKNIGVQYEQCVMVDASTQIKINVENIGVQYEQCDMVDANVGTVKISKKNAGTNTSDTNINCGIEVNNINAIKCKQNYCREIKRSLSENVYRKLSTATQTESPDRSKNSHHSTDAIASLPPIEKQSLVKSSSDVHSTISRYHRRCLPTKQRGKTWIT